MGILPNSCATATSPLMSLPPEIRSRIYDFALTPLSSLACSHIKSIASTYHSLQLACRSVREETRLLPFQQVPLLLPTQFGSNVTQTLNFMRRMQPWQITATRRIELSILGSTHEVYDAGKLLSYLKNGKDSGVDCASISPDAAFATTKFCPDSESARTNAPHEVETRSHEEARVPRSELRELDIKIAARNILMPTGDAAVGLQKALDLDSSPVFQELENARANFPSLRQLIISIDPGLSLKGPYNAEWTQIWKADLAAKVNGTHTSMPVDVQVTVHHFSSEATVMQEYFMALGGDEDWWGSSADYMLASIGFGGTNMLTSHEASARA